MERELTSSELLCFCNEEMASISFRIENSHDSSI